MATAERTYTINIRKNVLKAPRYLRAKKAVSTIRAFLKKHMKTEESKVKLGRYLNLKVWERGIKNPVKKITVVVKKDDKGIVTAELPDIPTKKKKTEKIQGAKTATEADSKGKEKGAEGQEKKTEAKPEAAPEPEKPKSE